MLDTSKKYVSRTGKEFIVIEHKGHKSVTVQFLISGYKTVVQASAVRTGNIKDRLHREVCGVGFIGDGKYKAQTKGKKCKSYKVWASMIERCYSDTVKDKNPSYKGCSVCKEWHNYQNFAEWFSMNYIEGFELDKDIKIHGNKIYSPDACCFVSKRDNSTFSSAKHYKLISPSGEIVDVYNLAEFCRKNNLTHSNLCKVKKGLITNHKGWSFYSGSPN